LLKLGFQQLKNFPGIFRRGSTYVGAYVDDLWLVAPSITALCDEMQNNGLSLAPPDILSFDSPLKYNGVEVELRKQGDDVFFVEHMQRYIELLVAKYQKMTGKTCLKNVDTPALGSLDVSSYVQPSQMWGSFPDYDPHSCIAGALYLSRLVRPDVAYAVSHLCRQVSQWSRGADQQLERLMAYLKSTSDLKIFQKIPDLKKLKPNREKIEFFSDADLGGDLLTSRSTGGDITYLSFEESHGVRHRWILGWGSKLLSQKCTSTPWSECSAHHRALCDRALPASLFLEEAKGYEVPVDGGCDNTPIISAVARGYSVQMRHLARHSRLSLVNLRHVYESGHNVLRYVSSSDNVADLCTKALPTVVHWKHVGVCQLRR